MAYTIMISFGILTVVTGRYAFLGVGAIITLIVTIVQQSAKYGSYGAPTRTSTSSKQPSDHFIYNQMFGGNDDK